MTLTHTAGVLALGAVALFASAYYHPQDISRFLQLPAGLLVLAVGVLTLRDAWRLFRSGASGHTHAHDHAHGHTHEHEHVHALDGDGQHGRAAAGDTPPSLATLVTLGVSGGMIPCPTALALLLVAIGEGQVAQGPIYVIVFSLGLTAVLVAIGLAMVSADSFATSRLPGMGLAR